MRAASLPGAGGTSARTPLMSNLVGKPRSSRRYRRCPWRRCRGGRDGAGLAPVGSGGGAGPMGMMGHGAARAVASKQGLTAPSPLAYDLAEDEEDDW